ncbi:MAG: hypothetical protein ACI4HI_08140 [Lachnospiraceae bacterium]
MPQTEERNLELHERSVNKREKRPMHTEQFELAAIEEHFEKNLESIKS